MKSTDVSCREFVSLLASDAPAPGGGGAAAYVGALGTALGNMVGSLTVGKPKYAEVEAEVIGLKTKADALQQQFFELVALDAEVFVPLSQAYGLPRSTEEEISHRNEVMAECLLNCAQVPLEIMRVSCEAIEVLERMEQIGTAIAISDVGCGAIILKAALLSAELNVKVNTKLMQNRSVADSINSEAKMLVQKYTSLADSVYQKVQLRFI